MTNRKIGNFEDSGERYTAIKGVCHLLEEPSQSAIIETDILFGERLAVHGKVGDYYEASIQFREFSHFGFIRASDVAQHRVDSTHRIFRSWAPVRAFPNLKSPLIDRLPAGSQIKVLAEDELGYLYKIWPRGWVFKEHVKPIEHVLPDFVAAILQFEGTPFQWGGRSSFGMDCAGLIQLGLSVAGIASPRAMTDMAESLGTILPPDAVAKRGDFLFYSDHSAMHTDETMVINSNGRAGVVLQESAFSLDTRMQKRKAPLICRRRLDLINQP